MSDGLSPSWLRSEDELFDWLSAKPRTYNWQVMVALDRNRTNQLLLQEYIQRYARDKYFDPVTAAVQTADTTTQVWEYLYDNVLGPPRLSFEVSDTNEWARLTMPLLGGVQMTVEKIGVGPKQVQKISSYDPLQAPRLIAEIRLEDTDGEVSSGNVVSLDLKRGTNFRLTFASTHPEQEAGGKLYKEIFDLLPEPEQRFILGTLKELEAGTVLQPDKFRLRALSAQPAENGEKEGAKEGAILLFIGMKGNEPGDLPDKEAKWLYPIPAGRSSTMLLSPGVVLKGLMAHGIETAAWVDWRYDFVEEGPEGSTSGLRFTNGTLHPSENGIDLGLPEKAYWTGRLLLHHPECADFAMSRVGEEIVMSWIAPMVFDHQNLINIGFEGPVEAWARFDVTWNLESRYRFELNSSTGDARLVLSGQGATDVEAVLDTYTMMPDEWLTAIKNVAPTLINPYILGIQGHVASAMREIELFRLYGLIFSGDQVVTHQSIRMPCDLAVFGDISPTRSAYQVSPSESNIPPGGSVEFSLSASHRSATWSLHRVEGFPDALGSITQDGTYTAPDTDDFPSEMAYTMVRVAAVDGDNSVSALVRIIRRSVVVNPMVLAAPQSSKAVRLSAGSLLGGKLNWHLESATGATLTATPPEADGVEFDEGDMFYIPGEGASGEVFSVDTITVEDAAGNKSTSHLVLLESTIAASVTILEDETLPEGKVKLALDLGSGPAPEENVVWWKLAGAGSVDEHGVYTMDPDSEYPYAVIAGAFQMLPAIDFRGYIILPLPLINLDDIRRALR